MHGCEKSRNFVIEKIKILNRLKFKVMATRKETRKTIAQKIYLIKKQLGEINTISMDRWVDGILTSQYIANKYNDLLAWYERKLKEIR